MIKRSCEITLKLEATQVEKCVLKCAWGLFSFLHKLLENNFDSRIFARLNQRSVRLGVRTPDFHSGNRGSIPLRTTKNPISTSGMGFFSFCVPNCVSFAAQRDRQIHL